MHRLKFLNLLAFAVLALGLSARANAEAYLVMSGVPGNSVRERWVSAVEAWESAFSQSLETGPKGATYVRESLTVTTHAGGATSVALMNMLAQQTVAPSATLYQVSLDPNGEDYVSLRVVLTNVRVVSSVVSDAPTQTAQSLKKHTFTLHFGSATYHPSG